MTIRASVPRPPPGRSFFLFDPPKMSDPVEIIKHFSDKVVGYGKLDKSKLGHWLGN